MLLWVCWMNRQLLGNMFVILIFKVTCLQLAGDLGLMGEIQALAIV